MPRKKSSDATDREGGKAVRRTPRKRRDKGIGGEDSASGDQTVAANGEETSGQEEAKEAEVLEPLPVPAKPTREISVGKFVSEALADTASETWIVGAGNISEAARQNEKRPAYIQFVVPDIFVRNLTGAEPLRDLYFLVRVKREHYERVIRNG